MTTKEKCYHLRNKQTGKYWGIFGEVSSVDDAMAFPVKDHPMISQILNATSLTPYEIEEYDLSESFAGKSGNGQRLRK